LLPTDKGFNSGVDIKLKASKPEQQNSQSYANLRSGLGAPKAAENLQNYQ